MTDKFLVRDLRPDDFTDILEYYYRFYDEVKEHSSFGVVLSHKKPSLSDEPAWFSNIYRSAAEGHSIVLVAEVKSHVVGLR